jgi:hypothetical protein
MLARASRRPQASVLRFAAAAFTIYAIAIAIVRTLPPAALHGPVAYALMTDLLVVVPGLWFWLMIRGRRMSAATMIPVLALSAAGAALILPARHRGDLGLLVAPLEALIAGTILWAVIRRMRRRAGAAPLDHGELPERVAEALRPFLGTGRLADAAAYELAGVAFALGGWRMRPRAEANAFTLHRESGWPMAAVGLGLVLLVEGFPMHVLVARSNPALAWGITALGVLSLFWLIGDFQGLRLRPCRIERDALLVRVGLRWKARVPLALIAAVSAVGADAPPRREPGYLRATVIGDPTVLLRLSEPVKASGPYGLTRGVRTIGLAPDDQAGFLAALAAARDAAAGGVTGAAPPA